MLFGLPAMLAAMAPAAKMSVIGSVAGAAINQANRNRDTYLNSPAGIRAEAEKAGFNPLLFTGAAGSFGAGYSPTMGSNIAQGFALAGEQEQREMELILQRTALEQENQRLSSLAAQNRLNVPEGGIYDDAPLLAGEGSPRLKPALENAPTVRVYLPDGQARSIPQPVADALGKKVGDYILAGDFAELTGELRGEIEAALMSDEIGNAINVPLFGAENSSPDEVTESIIRQSKARGQEFSDDLSQLWAELRSWKLQSNWPTGAPHLNAK